MSVFQQRQMFAVLMTIPTFPGGPEDQPKHLARLKKLLEEDVYAIYNVHDNFEKKKSKEYDGSRYWDKVEVVPSPLEPVFEFVETPDLEIQEFVSSVLTATGPFTILFIEPNDNYTEAKRAWYCRGVEFKSFEAVTASRLPKRHLYQNNPICRLRLEVASRSCGISAKDVAKGLLKQIKGDPISMNTHIVAF